MEISEKDWEQLKNKEKLLKQSAEILHVDEKDVPRVLERFLKELEEIENKLNLDAPQRPS